MSQIDWSKAPKGTTGAMVANFNGSTVSRGDVEFIPSSGNRDIYGEGEDAWVFYPAPNPWIGEGLPPVGTVCEIRNVSAGSEWAKAEIKFASRNVVVWDWDGEPAVNGLCMAYVHNVQFRPIPTPEQIAAEDKQKWCRDALLECGHMHPSLDLSILVQSMYDKGYRKQQES